ncbi:sensor histidine kinase [Paenibacillus septentrionalis]|uniref:Sensor histidine kinase n=1 Tax=Paenibacillus septentrionalis TaxID=429342 RepID=A0ABW1VCA1_9BACL
MKLRQKILIANILLVFIPVIAMGAISYSSFSKAITKKSSNFYSVSLLETDRKLHYALSEITSISNSAITQPVIQQALKNQDHIPDYDIRQEINNLLIHHPMVQAFQLYSRDRLVYSYNSAGTFADLKNQSWFTAMESAEGRPIWSGPGENGTATDDQPVLIHARVIKDYYSLEDLGSIVIQVKANLLDQVFWETATMEQGNILLLNKSGFIVYDKSGEHTGSSVSFPFLYQEDATDQQYFFDDYHGIKSLITYLPSQQTNWFLVAITPTSIIQAESVTIRNIAVLLASFSLLSAFIFDRFFVLRLIKSISRTVNGMRRVEQRNFVQIPVETTQNYDESDMLVLGFNRMSTQIEELLHQVELEQTMKKEAELQALVSQINPHFIYNSLESINSMAVLQGNKDISRMVISLGRLLRISISENKELIPLSTEFEHVRHYMNIQKYRFEDKFEYTLELPEHLQHYVTQKLIVQPLVENALYYAIEPMESKGYIHIVASENEHDIFIDITDNGPGFDEQVLLNLLSDRPSINQKYKDSSVGLRNVHERVRIRFGHSYGMMICSSPGLGSTIRIRVPKIVP